MVTRKSAIETVWRLTVASFAFAQIIGIVVVVTVFASNERVPSIQVLAAYAVFVLFSTVVFLAARFIARSTLSLYSASKHD